MVINLLRTHYPNSSLITELITVEDHKYIVRALVQVEGTPLVSALAAAETVELADDRARTRVLAILGVDTSSEPRATMPLESPPPYVPTQAHSLVSSTANPRDIIASEKTNAKPAPEMPVPTPPPINGMAVADEELTGHVREETSMTEMETSQATDAPLWTQNLSPTPVSEVPSVSRYGESKLEAETNGTPVTDTSIDFSEVITRTDVELKRLGWTKQQGQDYLVQTYNKRSRQSLTDEELLDFLHYLEAQPTETIETQPSETDTPLDFSEVIAKTDVELKRLGWTKQQGQDYLVQTYNKPSRQSLTDEELLDFLHYLETQPTETVETQPTVMDTPIDFREVIDRTNVELKRLGWTTQQGRDYLLQTYGKRSRQLLTDEELLDFLHYLEVQPSPTQ